MRPKKLTDEELQDLINKGFGPTAIAEISGVSRSAVNQRIKKLTSSAVIVAAAPAAAQAAYASMWDTKQAAEDNYKRALTLLEDCHLPGDKRATITEIRKHLEFAMNVMETLYNIQETQAFMDEVMNILDECEPGSRKKILEKLAARRSIRGAIHAGAA
jgi:predicted DNA-binding protein YlxM (UPF0122 family)